MKAINEKTNYITHTKQWQQTYADYKALHR
jgi:hypothetical protein